MATHWEQVIAELVEGVHAKQLELAELMRSVNVVCRAAGLPEKFSDIGAGGPSLPPVSAKIASDQFVGKALNTAVKEVLTIRRAAGDGPTSAEDIYASLLIGGYEFDARDKDSALAGLRISLGKSTHTFKKLNNGLYGLHEWYGTKPAKKTAKDGAEPAEVTEAQSDAKEDNQ